MKNTDRLKYLRRVACLALLAGIGLSRELWFPIARSFPRAPLFISLPESAELPLEWLLSAILALSLFAIIFDPRAKLFSVAALGSLLALVFFDQTRLQPWTYQAGLILLVLTLHDRRQADNERAESETLLLAQITIAALYFWSGVQKMNYSFASEVVPQLLAPLKSLLPAIDPPFVFTGIALALAESSLGIGLLFPKSRQVSVWAAVLMHLTIGAVLIAKDYNSVVWAWNAALIAMVLIVFGRSDLSLRQLSEPSGDRRRQTAKALVAASALLPALSFFGLWDMFLSGALYSGNIEVAVVRLNEDLLAKLPPKARETVLATKSGEKMLPLFEWSMSELNAPVYPETRVFMQAARRGCRLTDEKNQVELIVKNRPAIFDGSFALTRKNCAELEKK